MNKPGYQTTEFWLALMAQLAPLLVIFGVLSQAEAETLAATASQFIAAGVALVAAAMPVWKYIESRTIVKTQQYKTQQHEE